MRRSLMCISLLVALMAGVTSVMARDSLLNRFTITTWEDNYILNIDNLRIGESFYTSKWQLTPELCLRLSDAGVISANSTEFVDMLKVVRSVLDLEEAPEQEIQQFDVNATGCEKFFLSPSNNSNRYLACIGSNFYKLLAKVSDSRTIYYFDFVFPRFIRVGTSLSGTVHTKTVNSQGSSTGHFFYTLTFFRSENGTLFEHFMWMVNNGYFRHLIREFDSNYHLLKTVVCDPQGCTTD